MPEYTIFHNQNMISVDQFYQPLSEGLIVVSGEVNYTGIRDPFQDGMLDALKREHRKVLHLRFRHLEEESLDAFLFKPPGSVRAIKEDAYYRQALIPKSEPEDYKEFHSFIDSVDDYAPDVIFFEEFRDHIDVAVAVALVLKGKLVIARKQFCYFDFHAITFLNECIQNNDLLNKYLIEHSAVNILELSAEQYLLKRSVRNLRSAQANVFHVNISSY